MIVAAERLARAGIPVFPCGADKRALVKWRDESSCDLAALNHWPAQGALAGVDLAKAGLIVIDCDRHGGPDGVAAFAGLVDRHGLPAGVPIVETAGGGLHYFFAQPGDVEPFGNATGDLPDGIDVRGAGGYVIAPGSALHDGRSWRTANGAPDLVDAFLARAIPVLPDWLRQLIRPLRPETLRAQHRHHHGEQNSAYTNAAVRSECAAVATAPNGGRNERLNRAAFSLGQLVGAGALSETEASAALLDAALEAGLGLAEARATIKSGLSKGQQQPREIPQSQGARTYKVEDPAPPEWQEPKPLPSGLLPVAAFDMDFLPEQIAPWVADISDRMQCPPDFVGITAIVALGAALGRKIGIRPQRRTDWTEVANLWGCIVGRPGAMKSPAMTEVLKPLQRLEAKSREANDEARKRYESEVMLHKIRKEEAAKMVRQALKKGDAAANMLDIEEPEPPAETRYIVNDTSYEKLGEILSQNPNGVLAFRDELLALLKTLDREEHAAARGFYLQAWNGTGGYTFDRIIRGHTHIEAACVSLLGGTQPAKLADYMHRAMSGRGGDDGLIQRFGLLVWPDQSPEWQEQDRYPDTVAREAAWSVFGRLTAAHPEQFGAEQDAFGGLPYLRFDEEAGATFKEWRADLEKRLRSGELTPAMESHLSKYRKLVPALALIIHLADGRTGPVEIEPTLKALSFSEYLETHARRAYSSSGESEVAAAKAILERIRKGDIDDGFSARDVQRRHWSNLSDTDQIKAGLELLADLGWLAEHAKKTGGRPQITYSINPGARHG